MEKINKIIKTMKSKIYYCGEHCKCFTIEKYFVENDIIKKFEINENNLNIFEDYYYQELIKKYSKIL